MLAIKIEATFADVFLGRTILLFEHRMQNTQYSKFWSWSLAPWVVLFALSLIWGSSFILIKKSLLAFSPDEVGTLRIGISTIAITPLLIARWKRQNWSYAPIFLAVGLTGNLLPALLFSHAEVKIDSGIAGVLNSLTPLFTIIIAWLFFSRTFKTVEASGILLGFIGASFLILFGTGVIDLTHINYGLLIVLATFCYGISVNVVNHKLSDVKPLDITIMSFASVGFFAWVYLFSSTDFIDHATTHPDRVVSILSLCTLAIVGTTLSTIVFYKLVQRTDAIFGSLVSYLIPLIALMWGVVDGEVLVWSHFLGFLLILIGIYLVKRKPSKIQTSD